MSSTSPVKAWPLPLLLVRMAQKDAEETPEGWAAASGWPVEVVNGLLGLSESQLLVALAPGVRGLALRTMRKQAGLFQADAAKQAGVATNTLNRWETGTNCPSEALLGFFLTACGR